MDQDGLLFFQILEGFPFLHSAKMSLKVSCSIVLKIVSGSENGPLSDSGVRFPI